MNKYHFLLVAVLFYSGCSQAPAKPARTLQQELTTLVCAAAFESKDPILDGDEIKIQTHDESWFWISKDGNVRAVLYWLDGDSTQALAAVQRWLMPGWKPVFAYGTLCQDLAKEDFSREIVETHDGIKQTVAAKHDRKGKRFWEVRFEH